MAERRTENQNKENVIDLLGLVLNRLNLGDAYSSPGYFSGNFDEEAQETKLLMKEIKRIGLAPRTLPELAHKISPEEISRYGETVWIEHLSKIRPYAKIHGIEAAKSESERLNLGREQNQLSL